MPLPKEERASAPRTKEMLEAAALVVAALEPLTVAERKRALYSARVMLGIGSYDGSAREE